MPLLSHFHHQQLYHYRINNRDDDEVDKTSGIGKRFQEKEASQRDENDPGQREQGVVQPHIQPRRNETSVSISYQEHSKDSWFRFLFRKVLKKGTNRS